jgi:beta-N-acetylhexosaminidase
VKAAISDGRISAARLDQAVLRILGLKAAQGLNDTPVIPPSKATGSAFSRPANVAAAGAMFARMPTLVKDTQGLLPLNPVTHKRVLIFTNRITFPFLPEPLPFALPDMLSRQGFDVTVFATGMEIDPLEFDLHLYLLGDESLLTRSHIFIDWAKIMGDFGSAMRRYWHDIPTAMISFGHPYYLYDAPRVPTYINAYSTLEEVQAAVIECLLGHAPFNAHNPVDPFCGDEQAEY